MAGFSTAALLFGLVFGLLLAVALSSDAAISSYLDTTATPEQRAKSLVAKLTLEQQVGLLLAQDKRTGGVAEYNISDYNWWTECNSGIGVEYPQNVNIAATFNRTVAFVAGRGTGIGLRVRADAEPQDLSCWSPMTNIMRHPLWGRGHEGYGEDPYLAGEMVYQNVLGIQGYGLNGYPKFSLANTGCKHFSVFDGPLNRGTAVLSDYDWFLNYLPQFERCLDAGSYSVMCSYAKLNGVYGCADSKAMTTILRDTWKLRGFVVSDCGAVGGGPAGAVKSLEAGCDLECNPWGGSLYPSLVNSTLAHNVSRSYISTAAERLLYVGLLNTHHMLLTIRYSPYATHHMLLTTRYTLTMNSLYRYVRFRLGAFDPPDTVPFANKSLYGKDADMSRYEQSPAKRRSKAWSSSRTMRGCSR
jgi:beta-glucosidase